MRFLLLLSVLIAPARSLSAQDTSEFRYPSPGQRSPAVASQYDSAHDKTVLRMGPFPLDSVLTLKALVALDGPGRPRTAADGVVLTFESTSPSKRLSANRDVGVSINGGGTDSLGTGWLVPNPAAGYTEAMLKSVALETWLRVANAHEVALTVGGSTYRLSPEVLIAIRDFSSRMTPATGAKR